MRLDQFYGVNAGYVYELYERYRQHPESVDPATREVRRVIRTAGTISDELEMDRVRRFRMGEHDGGNAFDGGLGVSLQFEDPNDRYEPFALLHAAEGVQ